MNPRVRCLFGASLLIGCAQSTLAVQPTRTLPPPSGEAVSIVQSLTDTVGPRLAGSEGDARAVAWALGTMKRLGLSNVHAEPVEVPHWDRGASSAEIVTPVHQRLAVTALGGSVGTAEAGVEAEVVEAGSLQELNALPDAAVTGKIVFFNKFTERTKTGEGYGKAVDVRGAGPVEAAKKGALAVVIRSIATSNSRLPHTGMTRYEDAVKKIPAAALGVPDAELLHRLLAAGPVKLRLSLGARMLAPAQSANVIGEIPGSEHPEQIVLLGAHLDSWDLATGAIDDGAGVGIVLEAARQLAKAAIPVRRTVRVVLYANEEFGLSGALAYAKAHATEMDQHILGTEADHGTGAVYGVTYTGGPGIESKMEALVAPLKSLGVSGVPNRRPSACGADLNPLKAAGVPCVTLAQDGTTYFDFHHSADDTFDKIDPAALSQAAAAMAALAGGAAQMDGDLGRIPTADRGGHF